MKRELKLQQPQTSRNKKAPISLIHSYEASGERKRSTKGRNALAETMMSSRPDYYPEKHEKTNRNSQLAKSQNRPIPKETVPGLHLESCNGLTMSQINNEKAMT